MCHSREGGNPETMDPLLQGDDKQLPADKKKTC